MGQGHIAQSILAENKIGKGDLFLFFGWFNRVVNQNGKYKYSQFDGYNNYGVHLLYGYLEVGMEPIDINSNNLPGWVKDHPHYIQKGYYLNPNVIYVASERFSLNSSKPGAGIFKFNEDLILTEKDKSRTNWLLPDFFHPDKGANIKYLPKQNWNPLNGKQATVKSSSRGQEFVVLDDSDKKIEQWAVELINKHEVVT